MLGEKSLLPESPQIDEQRIAGKCRKALIGGIAISGGAERQYLPNFLSGVGQEFYKLVSRISEIANAMATGQ